MKSALCLFGIVGGASGQDGKGGPIDIKACYKSYKKHIIDVNNCDVFIHSWSTKFRDRLLELYEPKDSLIELQIDFSEEVKKLDISTLVDREGRPLLRNPSKPLLRTYSRWYSTKKVVELKSQYEKENNFKYDWVMVGRLDLLFFVDFLFKNLDSKYFCTAPYNRSRIRKPLNKKISRKDLRYRDCLASNKSKALLDLFFVANSDMMNKFSTVYDHLGEYKRVSPHANAWQQIEKVLGDPKKVIQYSHLYWGFDFVLWRTRK